MSENNFRLGSDPEKLFPYSKMLEHLHRFGRYGLIMASMLLPIITKEAANEQETMKNPIVDNEHSKRNNLDIHISEKSRDKFEKRLRDVVVDMIRLDYI